MELDWTTFALEILNFLVLVWILTRLLYRPVMKTIAERKAEVQNTLSEADRLRKEAQALQEQYEHRQADWRQEAERVRSRMLEEVSAERARLMADLQVSLQQERDKARALEERRLSDLQRQVEEAAVTQGGEFAAKLLARLASPDLEAKLVDVVIEDLRRLPEERREAIRTAYAKGGSAIVATSAHVLDQSHRDALAEAIHSLLGHPVSFEWREDPSVLAGVRLSLGPWMLGANLQDELRFFSDSLRLVSPTHAS